MRTTAVLKKNHLSSKDKAVSCSKALVTIHHCEKPLVKLSEHGSRGPTLITAGIWKFWLCCTKIKSACKVEILRLCNTSESFLQLRMEFRNSPTDQSGAVMGGLLCVSKGNWFNVGLFEHVPALSARG